MIKQYKEVVATEEYIVAVYDNKSIDVYDRYDNAKGALREIADEYDEDDKLYEQIDDKTYEFEGKILLNDFYKILDISPDEFDHLTDEVDTLAGLMLEMFEEMPHVSEHVSYKNYTFTIVAMEKRRIKRIKLEID